MWTHVYNNINSNHKSSAINVFTMHSVLITLPVGTGVAAIGLSVFPSAEALGHD